MSTRGVSQLHFSRGSEILQVQVLTDVNCGPTPHLTEAEAPVPNIFFAPLPPSHLFLRSPMCVTHVCHSLLINLADFRD